MDFEKGKKFIDMLLTGTNGLYDYYEAKRVDGIILEFIGGELFLAIDLIDKLTDYFIDSMIKMRTLFFTGSAFQFVPMACFTLTKRYKHTSKSI